MTTNQPTTPYLIEMQGGQTTPYTGWVSADGQEGIEDIIIFSEEDLTDQQWEVFNMLTDGTTRFTFISDILNRGNGGQPMRNNQDKFITCGGCGSSFDSTNNHEAELYKNHNCETFDAFCDNYGAVENCDCGSCKENRGEDN
jgi:hypothetical protein